MKKLFSLMVLALMTIWSGVSAQETNPVKITWNLSDLITTGVCDPATAVLGNATLTVGKGLSILDASRSYSDIDFMQFQPISDDNKGDNKYGSTMEKYIDFTITPSASFALRKVTFDVVKIGTGDPKIYIDVIDGDGKTTTAYSDVEIRRNDDTGPDLTHSYEIKTSPSTNAVTLRILIGKLASNKQVGLANVVIEGDIEETTTPVITATDASISATESGVEVTKDIAVTGVNLDGKSLTATLSPEVPGLSVTLASSDIISGAISTTATLHYKTNSNASGLTTLTLSDGTTSKSVTITYKASVVNWALQTISEATTWDFTKLTINKNSDRYNSGDDAIKLSDTTTPSKSDEIVYEDYNGGDIIIGSGFNGTTLAFTGAYPIRKNQYCQDGILHFKTLYPGYVTAKFSDTGSTASSTAVRRYLVVNGQQTEYWASRANNGTEDPYEERKNVEAKDIYVPAGDVYITGSSAIQISVLSFTPATTYVDVSDKLYRTFASSSSLDFTEGVEGLTAYAAIVEGDNVKFEPITGKVPAKTGMLLKADAPGRYIIVKALDDETTAIENNVLKGVAGGTEIAEKGSFVLFDGDEGLGFYQTTAEAFTVGANTAYIPANVVSPARTFISLDGETTGVNAVESVEATDGKFFDLQGRQVSKPTKGLYISNGKKYVVK